MMFFVARTAPDGVRECPCFRGKRAAGWTATMTMTMIMTMTTSATTILALALIVTLSGCHREAASGTPGSGASAKSAEAAAPIEVRAVQVESRVWPRLVRIQGNLIGDEQAVIGAKVAGRVRSVAVDLGVVVKKGQAIASLDQEEFDLKVQQSDARVAEARAMLGLKPNDAVERLDRSRTPAAMQEWALLEDVQSQYERSQALVARKAFAVEELRRLEAQLRVARAKHAAALNQADNQVAALRVAESDQALAKQAKTDAATLAPFDGVVAERHVAPGVYVQVGQPVVTLVRTNPLRFRGGVPEREALRVKRGQGISIEVEGWPEPLAAQISRVSPSIDPASRSLMIEVDVPNPDFKLRAGLFAEADVTVDPDAKTLIVPRSAVIEFAGVEKVWTIQDGKAVEQRVFTGRRDSQSIEILKGLDPSASCIADARQGKAGPVIVKSSSSPPPSDGAAAKVAGKSAGVASDAAKHRGGE